MLTRRLLELLAIAMIGEGVAGLLRPRRYLLLWQFGPRPYQNAVAVIAQHPRLVRLVAAGEIGLCVWLSWRQTAH